MTESESAIIGFKNKLFKKLKSLRQKSGIENRDYDLIVKKFKEQHPLIKFIEFEVSGYSVVFWNNQGRHICEIGGRGEVESFETTSLYYIFILFCSLSPVNIDRIEDDTLHIKIAKNGNSISIHHMKIENLRNTDTHRVDRSRNPIELQGGMEGSEVDSTEIQPNINVNESIDVASIAAVTGNNLLSRNASGETGLDMTVPEDNMTIDELFELIKTPGTIDVGGSTFAQAVQFVEKYRGARQKAFAMAFCMLFVLKPKNWILRGKSKGRLTGEMMTPEQAAVAARFVPMKTAAQIEADKNAMSPSELARFEKARLEYGPFYNMNRNLTIVVGLLGFELFYDRRAHPNIENYVAVFKSRYGQRPMEITENNLAYHSNPRDTNRDISNEEAISIMENRKYLINLFQNGYANYKSSVGL
jgi:hypothetical protein